MITGAHHMDVTATKLRITLHNQYKEVRKKSIIAKKLFEAFLLDIST